ncbi:MAG: nucleotidyltransferase family protein [Eubacterium sp.]|nr:nucleotidyltransferase family protein [Eubacterium sp.]
MREKDYLIKLLRAYLYGETPRLDTDIDYQRLYELSNSHNLSAVVFCVINQAENKYEIDKSAFKCFENDFLEAVVRYDIQKASITLINSVLSENGIRHVFFKGSRTKELFPVPEARVMSDIDVLIDKENRDKAKSVLVEKGFDCVNSNGPVYDYKRDGVLFEVHTKIISGKVGSVNAEECFENAIENAAFDGFEGTLDNNYHFAYIITHIAHHFWFYGAGVKMILDLAVLLKSADIDKEAVFKKLDEVGLTQFGKTLLTLCNKWFGVGGDYGENTEKTEEFLLSFGAFGNTNRNKAAVVERKELEEGKSTSPVMTRLRLLFPPYSKLKNIPYIKFIEGRPYLVPYAWVYRFFYNFKNRSKTVKRVAKNIGSDETKSDAQNELAYFKEIGLL